MSPVYCAYMRSCQGQLQTWLEAMAPYVKGMDPNHLLSIGEEGFYSTADVGRGDSDPEGANSCASQALART